MKAIGAIIVVLALVIGIVPAVTQCQAQGRAPLVLASGGTVPMKCHWTAQASLAAAVPLLAVGGVTLFSKRKETRRGLAVIGTVLGAAVISLPTWLIGVCAKQDMLCNAVMRPTLILSGILLIGASVVSVVLSERSKDPIA